MSSDKVDMFLTVNGNKFDPANLNEIRTRLGELDDNKLQTVISQDFKSPSTILIISILVGGWGIDRFMLGETGLGIAKLLTCGGLGIWAIIDWFSAQQRTRDYNYQLLNNLLR